MTSSTAEPRAARRAWALVGLGAWLAFGCSRDGEPPPAASSAAAPTDRSAIAQTQPATSDSGLAAKPPERRDTTGDATLVPLDLKPGERLPLLMFLHGLGGSGGQSAAALELARFAERERVIVLAPDGALDSGGRRFWNAQPACCNFAASGVDHVRELEQHIDAAARRLPVDEKRIYVVGFSNGGFMALRLACDLGARLQGVASIAGAGPGSEASCSSPPPRQLLLVHGDQDSIVRYQGGSVFDDPALARHASAVETFQAWAERAGCESTATAREGFDALSSIAGRETVELFAEGCRRGGVSLWTVHGGGHPIGGSVSLFERIWQHFEARSQHG